MADVLKLNIGCGGNPLSGYTNIDQGTLEEIRLRYPEKKFSDDVVIEPWDVFKLPLPHGSVDEILADSFIEHLSFTDEPRFLMEAKRVLKFGAILNISVPDFEEVCRIWLAAKDDWKDFYRIDEEAVRQQHWFGNYGIKLDNRWGYLTATLFGAQNAPGMYHLNAYSEGKFRAIAARLGFAVASVERFQWRGDREPMLRVILKNSG